MLKIRVVKVAFNTKAVLLISEEFYYIKRVYLH